MLCSCYIMLCYVMLLYGITLSYVCVHVCTHVFCKLLSATCREGKLVNHETKTLTRCVLCTHALAAIALCVVCSTVGVQLLLQVCTAKFLSCYYEHEGCWCCSSFLVTRKGSCTCHSVFCSKATDCRDGFSLLLSKRWHVLCMYLHWTCFDDMWHSYTHCIFFAQSFT